jgi:hypothetical protein
MAVIIDDSETYMNLVDPNFLLTIHSKNHPLDSSLEALTEFLTSNKSRLSSMHVLALSDGGGPSSSQRKRIQEVTRGASLPRCAVITTSPVGRFVVSALSLFAPNIKVFETDEMTSLLKYLSVDSALEQRLRTTLSSLAPDKPNFRALREVAAKL